MNVNKVKIDLRDLWLWNKFAWNFTGPKGNQYFACTVYTPVKQRLKLHRVLTGAVSGNVVDHKNGDTSDNRRCNLRITDKTGNNQNARKRKDGASRWKGVYPIFNTTDKVWAAHIRANKVRRFLGCFISQEDAATAYNFAAAELHGEFAVYNTIQQPWLEAK